MSAPATPLGMVLVRWSRMVFAAARRRSAEDCTVCQSDSSVTWAVSWRVFLIRRFRDGVGVLGLGVSRDRSVRCSVSGIRAGWPLSLRYWVVCRKCSVFAVVLSWSGACSWMCLIRSSSRRPAWARRSVDWLVVPILRKAVIFWSSWRTPTCDMSASILRSGFMFSPVRFISSSVDTPSVSCAFRTVWRMVRMWVRSGSGVRRRSGSAAERDGTWTEEGNMVVSLWTRSRACDSSSHDTAVWTLVLSSPSIRWNSRLWSSRRISPWVAMTGWSGPWRLFFWCSDRRAFRTALMSFLDSRLVADSACCWSASSGS